MLLKVDSIKNEYIKNQNTNNISEVSYGDQICIWDIVNPVWGEGREINVGVEFEIYMFPVLSNSENNNLNLLSVSNGSEISFFLQSFWLDSYNGLVSNKNGGVYQIDSRGFFVNEFIIRNGKVTGRYFSENNRLRLNEDRNEDQHGVRDPCYFCPKDNDGGGDWGSWLGGDKDGGTQDIGGNPCGLCPNGCHCIQDIGIISVDNGCYPMEYAMDTYECECDDDDDYDGTGTGGDSNDDDEPSFNELIDIIFMGGGSANGSSSYKLPTPCIPEVRIVSI